MRKAGLIMPAGRETRSKNKHYKYVKTVEKIKGGFGSEGVVLK